MAAGIEKAGSNKLLVTRDADELWRERIFRSLDLLHIYSRRLGTSAGDLYLVLEVVLPTAHTESEREIYKTMAREMAFNPRQAA